MTIYYIILIFIIINIITGDKKEMYVIKSFSIGNECANNLKEIHKKTKINNSTLIRMFVNYFHRNNDELDQLIKGDNDEKRRKRSNTKKNQ